MKTTIALFLLLVASAPVLAQSRVQFAMDGYNSVAATNLTPDFGSNVTSGNWVITIVRSAGAETFTVTDSLGTAYNLACSAAAGSEFLYVHYGQAPSTGANTVTFDNAGDWNVPWAIVIEVSGLAAASPLDTCDDKSGSATTDIVTDAITTSQAATYVVMGATQNDYATYTVGADFTLVSGTIPDVPEDYGGVQDRVTSSILSSYTPHITSSVSADYSSIVVAFKAATSTPCLRSLLGVGCDVLLAGWRR